MECKSINSHVSIFTNYGTVRPCCSINVDDKFEFWESSSIFNVNNLNETLNLPVRNELHSNLSNDWVDEYTKIRGTKI